MFSDFKDLLLREFPGLTPAQLSQFEAMEPLYREWNDRINVISRKDIDCLYEHHVLHSLAIASYVRRNCPGKWTQGLSVLDLGTGGGFPGIPLAIMFPSVSFTLCDSIGKKVRVASEVASALGLKNVTTVNARAESLPGPFDFVVSRAVTSLENFYPWVKGKFKDSILYLKGGDVNDEISALLSRSRLKPSQIHCWEIESWLKDEYFKEKFVIQIEKS